jgi:hypothetical protein
MVSPTTQESTERCCRDVNVTHDLGLVLSNVRHMMTAECREDAMQNIMLTRITVHATGSHMDIGDVCLAHISLFLHGKTDCHGTVLPPLS